MKRTLAILVGNPLSALGVILVAAVVLAAIFADLIAPFPEHRGAVVDFANFNQPPSWQNIFGTDLVGRDLFSRVIFAYRISLILGVVVLVIAVPVGVTVGLVAGYLGGWTETVLMRVTDVFLSIPPLVLAMSMMGLLEPTLTNGMLAVTVMWWPWYTRLVYNITRSEKEEGYVARRRGDRRLEAARDLPRDPAQLCAGGDHEDDARPRLRHPHRVVALFPRSRRSAADARLGVHGCRRRQVPARFLVADRVPRPGDPGCGVRLQPLG